MTKQQQDRQERGASAVEFALVLPILVALLFGIIDFGFAFNTQIALTQAAREGVRVEALDYDNDDSATRARQRTRDAFLSAFATGDDLDEPDVTECPNSDDRARVRADLEFSTGILRFGPFSLSGEAVMRCGG